MTARATGLRLLLSLLALPPVAFAAIAALRPVLYPGNLLVHLPVVLLSWLITYVAVHLMLSRLGQRKFQSLNNTGFELLENNADSELTHVFRQIDGLLRGGLLTRHRSTAMQETLLRRYFDFYRQNLQDSRSRTQLLRCMRKNIRADEAYLQLRGWLLKQRLLNLESIDLAEALHEQRPDDQAIHDYMVRQYLLDKRTHFRAAYFYRRALLENSDSVPEILELCLSAAMRQKATDLFAGLLYARALEHKKDDTGKLKDGLFACWMLLKDAYAGSHEFAPIAAEIERWAEDDLRQREASFAQRQHRAFGARIQRSAYHVQQAGLQLWTKLRPWRWHIAGGLAAVAALALLFLLLPEPEPEVAQQVVPAPVQAENYRFALQVGATRSARGANTELNRLTRQGVAAWLERPRRKNGWFKVKVGKYETKASALAFGDSLRTAGKIKDFFVVNYRQP